MIIMKINIQRLNEMNSEKMSEMRSTGFPNIQPIQRKMGNCNPFLVVGLRFRCPRINIGGLYTTITDMAL